VVVACASPAAIDGIHTLNSLDHVAHMQAPPEKENQPNTAAGKKPEEEVGGVVRFVSVEVPLIDGGAGFNKDVRKWTPEEVKKWLAVANGGKVRVVSSTPPPLPPPLTPPPNPSSRSSRTSCSRLAWTAPLS
jgi:hypothetical protein